jgi:hypothetical protein
MADYLSAKAANNFQVRRQLRTRSRYEVSNNPYLYGVATSNADDLVNTGPTLQCLRTSAADNRQIERPGTSGRRGRPDREAADAEARQDRRRRGLPGPEDRRRPGAPVKLYPVDVEADQVTTPAPRTSPSCGSTAWCCTRSPAGPSPTTC